MVSTTSTPRQPQTIGVLGGLGPRASAEFVTTIYADSSHQREQEAPPLILLSDPGYPDRSTAVLAGDTSLLRARLTADLETFERLGADRIVICCVTLHAVLPDVPARLRDPVISLIETILQEVVSRGGEHLMLCTTGARRGRVFERHPLWAEARGRIRWLDEHDQDALHETIYEIKRNVPLRGPMHRLEELLAKYDATSFIAGCTELHLLVREAHRRGTASGWTAVDPLSLVARAIVSGPMLTSCIR